MGVLVGWGVYDDAQWRDAAMTAGQAGAEAAHT